MNSINSGLPIVGQSFTRGSNQPATNSNKSFTIDRGKIPTQAKNFIAKYDTNKDGVLNFKEYQQAGTLTDGMKSTVSSPELAKALFAMYAGPSGTLNAAEWARSTVVMDTDMDGKVTQRELDFATKAVQEVIKIDPDLGISAYYANFVEESQKYLGQSAKYLPSGDLDPEAQLGFNMGEKNFRLAATGQLGKEKQMNFEKMKTLIASMHKEQYQTSDTDPLGTAPDQYNPNLANYLANSGDRLAKNASLAPQQVNPFALNDSRALQAMLEYSEIADLRDMAIMTSLNQKLEPRAKALQALPLNHPNRNAAIATFNAFSKEVQSLNPNNKPPAVLKVLNSLKSSFTVNPNLKKTLDLLKSLPPSMAETVAEISSKLANIYTIDNNAPTADIQKHLAMLEPMTESIYKTLMYRIGTPNDQNGQVPEIMDPKNWGTQAQNLSWTPFANNSGNGGGLSVWS